MYILNQLITAQALIAYWDAIKANQTNYLGEGLFTTKKQIGLKIEMIRGRNGLPVSLAASNFDADVPIRDRIGLRLDETEMPFFREKMIVKEKDRQDIMLYNNNQAIQTILSNIFDDQVSLIKSAKVVSEVMAMQLISSGRIGIEDNGTKYNYDYHFSSEQFVTPKVKWSDTENADPVGDIQRWKRQAKKNGLNPARAIVSSITWGYLLDCQRIKEDMRASVAIPALQNISDEDLKVYLNRKTGIDFLEYDEWYTEKANSAPKQFFPDNVVSFIPLGSLGDMVYGTTPEEADLMNGSVGSGINVQLVNQGIAVTTIPIATPNVNIETRVSEIVLPSLNVNGFNIMIAKVG